MGRTMGWLVLAAAVGTTAWASSAHAEPDGEALMRKAEEVMKTSSGYRGTWQVKAVAGEAGTLPMEIEVLGAPGMRFRIVARATGPATGALPAIVGAAAIVSVTISDGTTLYSTFDSGKRYTRRPVADGVDIVTAVILGHPFQPHTTFALVGDGEVAERPCHVIRVVRTDEPDGPPKADRPRTELFLDKATFRPLRLRTTIVTSPAFVIGMPAGSRPRKQTLVTTISLVREALNTSVLEQEFAFTPPSDAVDMTSGTGSGAQKPAP